MKHTEGKWKIRFMNREGKDDGYSDFFIEAEEPKSHIGRIEIMMEDFGEHTGYLREQKLADAKLIAEAGTVANECGLTPRQLLEMKTEAVKQLDKALSQKKELLEVLEEIILHAKASIEVNKETAKGQEEDAFNYSNGTLKTLITISKKAIKKATT